MPAPMMSATATLRQPATALRAPVQIEPMAEGHVVLDGQAAMQALSPTAAQAVASAQPMTAARIAPGLPPRIGSGLFNEAPRPTAAPATQSPLPEVPRPSLFNTVTGAFRRRMASPVPTEAAPPVRAEPMLHAEQRPEGARASVRLANGVEEPTLEIPAFLRRQTS